MSSLDQITVLILTLDEEANIARALESVKWARRILVIDSGSSDGTLEIVDRYPQAVVETRRFDSFAGQCNFGLSRISTEWVLSLDADYELSPELAEEIRRLPISEEVSGYSAAFVYRVYGKALRSTLYPPRTVLYRRDRAQYRDIGHGHRVTIEGQIRRLNAPIFHDDRKPLSRFLSSQRTYARLEADYLLSSPEGALGRSGRIRRMGWPAPALVFLYTLFVKRCIFDGWPGWTYTLQRTLAEILIALEILDRRLCRKGSAEDGTRAR